MGFKHNSTINEFHMEYITYPPMLEAIDTKIQLSPTDYSGV
jgi:hypothetical protein